LSTARRLQALELLVVDGVLVVEGLQPAGAEHGLAQPLETEDQEQTAHHQSQ